MHRLLSAATNGTFDDPVNARTIHLVSFGLIVVALALAGVTVWWWIASRVEHPALGPLEVMGSKRWLDAEPGLRRVRLDAARPVDGPEPADGVDEVVEVDDDVEDAPDFERAVRPAPLATPPARSGPPRDPLLQARRDR